MKTGRRNLLWFPLWLMSLHLLLLVACRSPVTEPESVASPTPEPETATPIPTSTRPPAATLTTPTVPTTPGPASLPALPAVLEPALAAVVSQFGGYTGAVATRGKYVYLGVGPRLVILDVSQSAHPAVIGQSEVLPAVLQAIIATGTHAYVATATGDVYVLDIANPANPMLVGRHIDVRGPWNRGNRNVNMALVSNLVYVIGGDRGSLKIVDVADPANPLGVGSYIPPGIDGRGVAIHGNNAYVAAGEQGLFIVDVSDPAQPAEVGHLPGRAWDVAISDSTAYVADGGGQLSILDLAEPRRPRALGSYETDEMAVNQVLVEGNTAYISDNLGTEGTYTIFYQYGPAVRPGNLQMVDVSNRRNPVRAGAYQTRSQIWSLAVGHEAVGHGDVGHVAGESVYVATGDLYIVDVSEPAHPVETGVYRTPGEIFDVSVADNDAYVTAGNRGLQVLDVSDPRQPIAISSQVGTPGHALRLVVVERHAYVTHDWRVGEFADPAIGMGLRIVNVEDSIAPAEVGYYQISSDSPSYLNDLNLAGRYLYLAKASGLQILDVASPMAPVEVSTVEVSAQGVAVAGNYAYVTGRDGLHIFDVADPAAPVELSTGYSGYGPLDDYSDYYTSQVAVAGDYAYLNYVTSLGDGRQDHLCVIDVSNALAPALLGCYDGMGEIRDITAAGETVYVAGGDVLLIIAAANPQDVRYVASANTWSVAAVGDTIYVAAGQQGLYILSLQE